MLVLEWLRDEIGGLEQMAAINRRKAQKAVRSPRPVDLVPARLSAPTAARS
jgi:hypothetical protein